jgi:hypothetical protein
MSVDAAHCILRSQGQAHQHPECHSGGSPDDFIVNRFAFMGLVLSKLFGSDVEAR